MPNEILHIDASSSQILPAQEAIQRQIYTVRGVQVMLDRDLAVLYQVETKHLNRAVKRNIKRFPSHFMFQLTKEEYDFLRYQNVTTNNSSESDCYVDSNVLRSQNVTTKACQITFCNTGYTGCYLKLQYTIPHRDNHITYL